MQVSQKSSLRVLGANTLMYTTFWYIYIYSCHSLAQVFSLIGWSEPCFLPFLFDTVCFICVWMTLAGCGLHSAMPFR